MVAFATVSRKRGYGELQMTTMGLKSMLAAATAALLLVPFVTIERAAAATDIQIRAAEIVGYGIFEASSSTRQKGFTRDSPAADGVRGVHFVDFTNDIPPELGTGFGFQYVINSVPRGAVMNVTNIIRFPGEGLQAPGGRTYTVSREDRQVRIGERDFYGYAFDEEWEIIPGDWVFEVWHDDARIIRKTFTVLQPE